MKKLNRLSIFRLICVLLSLIFVCSILLVDVMFGNILINGIAIIINCGIWYFACEKMQAWLDKNMNGVQLFEDWFI